MQVTGAKVFLGEFSHSIDEKGRLAVPKKFRLELQKGLIITRGLDNCLFVFTDEEWKKLAEQLQKLPLTQSNARAFVRLMFAGASEENLDKQGRIIVPNFLREYAEIQKNVVVAGLMNRVEIWAEDKWNDYKRNAEKKHTDLAEQLAAVGVI